MNNTFRVSKLILLFLILLAFGGFKIRTLDSTEICDTFNIKVTVSENRKVDVSVQNGITPYTYLFYDGNQKALTTEVRIPSIEILKSGDYKVMVLDSKGCSQVKEFTIF